LSLFHSLSDTFDTVGIIGGDSRQEYLAQILLMHGFPVITYAVVGTTCTYLHENKNFLSKNFLTENPPAETPHLYRASSLKELMEGCRVLACPVPLSRNGKTISSSMEREDLEIKNFLSNLRTGQIIFGGQIPASITKYCRGNSILYFDFMEHDSVALQNAVATAEGAIMEACRLSPRNFHKNKSIVIGYGKCGSILADRLHGMHSQITVCARSADARTRAEVCGFQASPIEALKYELTDASFVFNTVPSLVLTEEHLKQLPCHAVIVDIASAPGGVDYGAASSLGITSSLFLGIPGKVAPYSSAEILADTLESIIKDGSMINQKK